MSSSSKKSKRAEPTPADELSFEAAVAELSTIVERIEDGEIGLEETLAQRKRGEALIQRCRAILEQAEQDLQTATPDDLDAGDDT